MENRVLGLTLNMALAVSHKIFLKKPQEQPQAGLTIY